MTKKHIYLFAILLIGFFSFDFANAQEAKLEVTINGKSPSDTVERNDVITIKWSYSEPGKCWFNGNFAKDTQGRLTGVDKYFDRLPTSGVLYLYADHATIPNLPMLSYYIACQDSNYKNYLAENVYVYINETKKPYFEFVKPAQNASIKAGTNLKVKWKSDKKEFPKVDIYLDEGFQNNLKLLKKNYKNKGNYSWKIPKDFEKGQYRIIIKSSEGVIRQEQGQSQIFTIVNSQKKKEEIHHATGLNFQILNISQYIDPFNSMVPLIQVKITAKDGSAKISSLSLRDEVVNQDEFGKFNNLYLYNGNELLSQIDRRYFLNNQYVQSGVQYDFDFENDLNITDKNPVVLTLKGDIKQKNGGSARFMIGGVGYPPETTTNITGIGTVSNQLIWSTN